MNKKERKIVATLAEGLSKSESPLDQNELEELKSTLESMKEEEDAKFDNLSEGLRASEKGQAIERAAQLLEEAVGKVDEAIEAIEALETARNELIEALEELANAS